MPAAAHPRLSPKLLPATQQRLRRWWKRQPAARQDRYAMLAPLAAVLLFLATIIAVFGYLRLEEIEREQEAVRHDVEYAQQRLRLRLLERQEQLMRLARELGAREMDGDDFRARAEALIAQTPEIASIHWVDERARVRAGTRSGSVINSPSRAVGDAIKSPDMLGNLQLARDLKQPLYVQRGADADSSALLELYIPVLFRGKAIGMVLTEYSVDGLYRYGVPTELTARYAFALLDDQGQQLAGSSLPRRGAAQLLPWARPEIEFEMPVAPVGNGLLLRARGYRTSLGVVSSGLFWLVCALSAMTAWMLIGNWRHTRRRVQAQQQLVLETNFRRAMENSMPTGMRAMDLQGRITYVNAAFCQMTGWSEAELVGCVPPFPYWPAEDLETLKQRLNDELNGRTPPTGFQVRVKRKDGGLFDARIYVSPLIDAVGKQTGWMTSMTDITEPNRVREQLSASHERFTTVLEALDAAVSVAPLGSEELLFANKLYRQWFHDGSGDALHLSDLNLRPQRWSMDDVKDEVDAYAGLPNRGLADIETESWEVFVQALGKWLEIRTRYLTWVDGRLAQMVIATDITARRRAEEQAAAQAQRAQTASRLITMGEMASSVAHELNQPLTAINNYCKGMVSRVQSQQITPQELLSALEKTAKQAQRAGQIIQRIRAFVKRSEPNRTLSDVAQMVSEAIELAEIELRRFHVTLTHQVAPALPALRVDPILIEQVLVNLLKNAAESIGQAERLPGQRRIELRVERSVQERKPVIEFTVRDTGQGIAPDVMARLYEAFYTTKAEGMGIGLSLCRSIVESHQGRMTAQNLYNGSEVSGCSFSFWIPLTEVVAPRAGTPLHTGTSRV